MKIKFKNLDETQSGDDISNFYAENDIDLRLPDERPKNQIPQPWATTFNPPIDRMSHDQTAHLASPASYGASAEENLELDESLLYEKKDRCYHLAKQKYDVFPSAYASGAIVKCRKGKIRKIKRNEEVELDEKWSDKYKRSIDCDNPKGFSQRAHCQGREKNESLDLDDVLDEIENLLEGTFDKEKSQGLHGWFARKGGKGKSKGWVDCNTCRTNPKTGRKICKTCGRQSGEQRSKYPACRPTPSACNRRGTSKKRGPTRVSWKKKKNEE